MASESSTQHVVYSTSEVFNHADADVVLISKDNVKFRVHRANLISGSKVFADMFDLPSCENQERTVVMQESSKELSQILPYLYNTRIPEVTYSQDVWELVKLSEKFQINRAIEAIEATFLATMLLNAVQVNLEASCAAFVVGRYFGFRFIRQNSILDILKGAPPINEILDLANDGSNRFGPAEDGYTELINLMLRHYNSIEEKRFPLDKAVLNAVAFHCTYEGRMLSNWFSLISFKSTWLLGTLEPTRASLLMSAGSCSHCKTVLSEAYDTLYAIVKELENSLVSAVGVEA